MRAAARPLAAGVIGRFFGTKKSSALLTDLLIARRRDSHAQKSRSAEWREALGGVARALGVETAPGAEDGIWAATAAALQRKASSSNADAAARLFGGDAAVDGAELLALLSLLAGGGSRSAARARASAALVPAVAAAPGVLLDEGGVRRAAEVLAALRTRAMPGEALEAVERCPPLLGFDPARVRDNCLFLMGATAAAEGAAAGATAEKDKRRPLLSALALGAPAALGRPPPELRATWEFWVGGGPAYDPDKELRRWPAALELDASRLARRWALVSWSASAGAAAARRSFQRELVEMGPDALGRALGMDVARVREALGD